MKVLPGPSRQIIRRQGLPQIHGGDVVVFVIILILRIIVADGPFEWGYFYFDALLRNQMKLQATRRFRVNEKLVTSKMIDGEAIIINLATGMYHSLDKTGATVWVLVGAGYSIEECAAW